jgi:hypothetical protein
MNYIQGKEYGNPFKKVENKEWKSRVKSRVQSGEY